MLTKEKITVDLLVVILQHASEKGFGNYTINVGPANDCIQFSPGKLDYSYSVNAEENTKVLHLTMLPNLQ